VRARAAEAIRAKGVKSLFRARVGVRMAVVS
jgi:hypothetical protein